MTFYFDLTKKYGLRILKESTDYPGTIVYEDEFQIAAVRTPQGGSGTV